MHKGEATDENLLTRLAVPALLALALTGCQPISNTSAGLGAAAAMPLSELLIHAYDYTYDLPKQVAAGIVRTARFFLQAARGGESRQANLVRDQQGPAIARDQPDETSGRQDARRRDGVDDAAHRPTALSECRRFPGHQPRRDRLDGAGSHGGRVHRHLPHPRPGDRQAARGVY